MRHRTRHLVLLFALPALACSSDPGTGGTVSTDLSSCTAAGTTPIALAVGQFTTIDVTRQGDCLRLPGSGAAQEYVVVAYSGFGVSTNNGTSAPYALQSITGSPGASVFQSGGATAGQLAAAAPLSTPAQFELNLRQAERRLVASGLGRLGAVALPPAAPPAVGDRDSFNVCANTSCSAFNRVGATVQYAGSPGVIYVDDHQLPGADPLGAADVQQLGSLFDNYLYATDTTAFGRESDVNNDQHIAILMTPAVNNLTSDCTNGRIIGYSFSSDLVSFAPGSNGREIFYTIATAPATAKCKAVTRTSALAALPPTLIHELQHMISFNQHVLLRPGGNDQDVWLNEGLSHFAEELGWRTVPAAQCDCFSEFAGGDLSNAYAYLVNPESQYLIAPEAGDGTLPERGASWLFLRWLADHFSTDSILGTQFTRAMEQTSVVGAPRIAQITGLDFPVLVGEWQLSNWTDDLPGFPQDGMLTYRSWNFRGVFAANFPAVFSKVFPLTPDSTTGPYSHSGNLLAGSGRTVRYRLPAGSSGATIRMAGTTAGGALSAAIVPWLAVVRVQ